MMYFNNTQDQYSTNMNNNNHHVEKHHGYIENHHFDEADALLLGLEKSMANSSHHPTTSNNIKHWAPSAVNVGSNVNTLNSYLSHNEHDLLEPYQIMRPREPERRSSELKTFLDYAIPSNNRPAPQTMIMEPVQPSLFLEDSSDPFQEEERKRSFEQVSSYGQMPVTSPPPAKRSRTCDIIANISDDESSENNTQADEGPLPKFRDYQELQWQEQYGALLDYKAKHGHCCVPNTYKPNPTLGRWVKRQRYQYKLRQSGQQSTLVASRVEALESVGFVWDSHAALWEQRLNELKKYSLVNGHCNVPSTYPKNPQLSTWVKCQRRQYKLTTKGKSSNLTQERIAALDALGFVWDGRTLGNNNKSNRVVEKRRPRSSRLSARSAFIAI